MHFREFVLDVTDAALTAPELVAAGRASGFEPGHAVDDGHLLVCVTEQNTQTDIDDLAAVLGAALAQKKEQNA